MNPVLFLDFDGPLFPERHIPHSLGMSAYPGRRKLHDWISYWEMDETSVRQLNALYSIFPFDTVVSSSWKHFVDEDDVWELFEVNGLELHLHRDDWVTPTKFSSQRSHEISMWLGDHTVDGVCPDHIILDDPLSGSSLDGGAHKLLGFREPLFVNPDAGIDSDIFKIMQGTVTDWAKDPLSRKFVRNAKI